MLVVAAVTRFWNISGLPFMHDEFSALFRTEYTGFTDLIKSGVMENDMHPAGVQVFLYYWVQWVGFNEFWIKLPFALCGVITVFLFYEIGKQWFNETVALVSTSFFACTQFFVFYSQLARPYAMGLFAVMTLVFIWTKIIKSEKPSRLMWGLFAFSLFFAAIMHAFSMFAATIIYLSGLWFLNPKLRKAYFFAAIGAVILYSPHIPVFLFQLSQPDIGGWLGKPTSGFLFHFLWYFLHYYLPFVILCLGLFGLSVFTMDKQAKQQWKFRIIGAVWFSISYITAYLYSVYRTPIIQFSTLYFTFPFFLLFFFSFFKPLKKLQNLVIILVVLITGISTLVFQRSHFELMYNQGYDQTAKLAAHDLETLDNASLAIYASTPRMVEFYLEKEIVKNYTLFSKHISGKQFKEFVDNDISEYFIFALTDGGPADWIEMVRDKFPFLIHNQTWFNTEYFLFSRNQSSETLPVMQWNSLYNLVDKQRNDSVNSQVSFNASRIYGTAWQANCDTLFDRNQLQVLSVIASGLAHDTLIKTKIVLEIKKPDAKTIAYWQAGTLNNDTILPGEAFLLTTVLKTNLIQNLDDNSVLKAYIWNHDESEFTIKNMYIGIKTQSPKFYGLFEPI